MYFLILKMYVLQSEFEHVILVYASCLYSFNMNVCGVYAYMCMWRLEESGGGFLSSPQVFKAGFLTEPKDRLAG